MQGVESDLLVPLSLSLQTACCVDETAAAAEYFKNMVNPDGTRVVSGSGDRKVRVWDAVVRISFDQWQSGYIFLAANGSGGSVGGGGGAKQGVENGHHPPALSLSLSRWTVAWTKLLPPIPAPCPPSASCHPLPPPSLNATTSPPTRSLRTGVRDHATP